MRFRTGERTGKREERETRESGQERERYDMTRPMTEISALKDVWSG